MNTKYYLLPLILLVSCAGMDEEVSFFDNPADQKGQYPFLYSTDNALYMSWLDKSDQRASLLYTQHKDDSWAPVDTIDQSDEWFVNWADYPSIIADSNGPIAAHWLNKVDGGTYAYNVNISLAQDTEWRKSFTPHKDETATEHGFVSMIPWDDNRILAVWLDGRQTDGRADEDYFDLEYAMTLRGAIINKSGEVEEKFLIDDSVCDCCQTSLVKTSDGAVVAYRNRAEEEIRDIYFSRFDGNKWSSPSPIHEDNWKIGACPVNGPKLAANDSLIAVSWYTQGDGAPTIKASLSKDSGASFSEPVRLNKNRAIGRVNAAIYNSEAYFSWIEHADTAGVLKASKLTSNSEMDTFTVAVIDGSRKTGFPQMEIFNGEIIWAWTDVSDEIPHVKMAKLPLK